MRLPKTAAEGQKKLFLRSTIASFLLAILLAPNVLAFPQSTLKMFSLNNILGYDDTCDESDSSVSSTFARGNYDGIATAELGEVISQRIDELHDMVVAYSINYGLPWELAIAQGIHESSLGTNNASAASYYLHNEKHNYFGMNVGKGCGLSELQAGSCGYAYKTEEDGWYGYFHFMTNGHYKQAFEHPTDPVGAIYAIQTGPYTWACGDNACSMEGRTGYAARVGSTIKAIQQRAKEKGWDTSAEIAEKYPEYLQNAKKFAAGTEDSSPVTNDKSNNVSSPHIFTDKPTGLPNSSNSSKSSSSTSKDFQWSKAGWLQFLGDDNSQVIKDPATNYNISSAYNDEYNYTTKLNDKVGVPNKITLHSTEGSGPIENAGTVYNSSSGKISPAHFTIDMKNRKILQHFPISKPALALVENNRSAGVQIEIVGFSTDDKSSNPYYLYGENNFSAADWDFLKLLLTAISKETGIPITSGEYLASSGGELKPLHWEISGPANANNRITYLAGFEEYVGVLGHQHVPGNDHIDPGNIWSKIQNANSYSSSTSSSSNNLCGNSTSSSSTTSTHSNQDLAKLAVQAAWPYQGTSDGGPAGTCHNGEQWTGYLNSCTSPPKPKYKELFDKSGIPGDYKDCGHFIAAIVIGGGFDSNFPKTYTGNMEKYMSEHPDLWEEITNDGTNSKDSNNLQPGDLMVNSHHIQMYVGNYGGEYGFVTSASLGQTVGAMESATNIVRNGGENYRYFRYKGATTGSDGKLASGGMTFAQAQAFMEPYIQKANETSTIHSDITFQDALIHGTSCKYGTLNNCVAFSQWFVNRYTTANIVNTTNGDQFVNALIQSNQGFINGGTTPRPYAIFSFGSYNRAGWSSHNHTGVVLGIDQANDKIIIGEAGCGHGTQDGWKYVSELKLSDWTGKSGLTYAYTDDILKEDLIK